MSIGGVESFNPFTGQAAGDYFVGREDQIKQFKRALKGLGAGKPRHLYVAGLHGTGKTSYLGRLITLAGDDGVLGVLATIDSPSTTYHQIASIVRAVAEVVESKLRNAGASPPPLLVDWDRGSASSLFRVPKVTDRLQSNDVRSDLELLCETLASADTAHILVCIDEGQRLEPFALSALKNAIQHLDSYLFVLSLRLAGDEPSAEEAGRLLLQEKARDAEGDFGASRIFVSGVPLGPFSTQAEARECIMRRLQNNELGFDSEVLSLLVRITGRIPSSLIEQASDVYDLAANEGLAIAGRDILSQSFRHKNQCTYNEALALRGGLTASDLGFLRQFVQYDRYVTAEEVADDMYPQAEDGAKAALVEGVCSGLRRMTKSTFVDSKSSKFGIPDPGRRFALELALAMP